MNTIQFAEYELLRYTAEMGIYPKMTLSVNAERFDKNRFWHFNEELDDAFSVSVRDGNGEICATNSRALLMGVYHFLKMQGCRFMRPGKDGEYIPITDKVKDGVETWYAHARHRGSTDNFCGGNLEGMLSFIDWLPKNMMNSIFIEMTDFYHDFKGSLIYSETLFAKPESLSRAKFEEYSSWITSEISKRNLLRHGAGHGWTNMLMEGITETKRSLDIRRDNDKTPCKNPEILAEINGKRELFTGVPLNTNLCLSQEKVRKAFAEKVADYAVLHPEITYLHVWLADAFSNFCECENCRKKTPTDWYVMLLNDIDTELSMRNIEQKIVFLAYFELLYPPKKERIKNETRFTFLFCPYGRDFTKRYRDWKEITAPPRPLNRFERKDMHMGLYLAQLREWRKIFKGDCIVFDYNLFDSASHVDITNLLQAPVICDDCLYMEKLGIYGRIECGNTRAHLPTSLYWHAMSESLFYGREYDQKTYFEDMFGKGEPVSGFLESIQDALPNDYMLCRRNYFLDGEKERIREAVKKARAFRDVLWNYMPENQFHRKNCNLFAEYLELAEVIFKIMMQKAEGKPQDELEADIEKFGKMAKEKELIMPFYMTGESWFAHYRNGFRNKYEREEF